MEFICHPVVYCCLDLVRVILCNGYAKHCVVAEIFAVSLGRIKIGYYRQLPAFPSLFFNFLCGYFTDMSHVALRTDHDILRIFLELKNASEFILMYTTRFVLCQVHSYMTDMQMYTTANAEMTFTPPRYWNIPNYR